MRTFSFLAALMLIFAACSRNSNTVVRLHADGLPPHTTPVLMTKDSIYTLRPDSMQSVKYTLPATFEPAYGALFLDNSHVLLYIEPGKSFDVSVQMKDGKLIPTFTGKGAAKNRYLNSDTLRYTPDYNLDEAAFIAALDAQLQKLHTFVDSQGFDAAFTALEKKRLAYTVYTPLLTEYVYSHIVQTQAYDYSPTQAYYDKVDAIFTEDAELVDMAVYQQFIKQYVILKQDHNIKGISDLQYVCNELNYITQHFKEPAVIEYLVDNIIYAHVKHFGVSELPTLAPIFEANVHNTKKKAAFKILCDKWLRIAQGQPSPDFIYKDIHDKEVSLSDLAGKYVYIDIWATWCGPCRREQPFLEKLEKKYADKNIRFVSISCDQDRSAWEKLVKEEKLGGIQLQTAQDDDFMKTYMVATIPRFILINREGHIINAHMSRPSDPETEKCIEALKGL